MGEGVRRTFGSGRMPAEIVVGGELGGEDLFVGVVGAGLLDGRGGLAAVEGVEAAGDLAGELDVGDLVLTDGNEVGLIEEDVGGLQEWVAEEAVGVRGLSRGAAPAGPCRWGRARARGAG